jgi:general secretion pathway protein M
MPLEEQGSLGRVALRLSISVGIDGLRDIVHAIETGKPLLFVDDLTVRTVQQKDGGTDPHYLGPLQVDLQLSGFRLKDRAA